MPKIPDLLEQFHYTEKEPVRLDLFLVKCLPDHSRSRIQVLIKDGFVSVNEQVVTKASFMLVGDEAVLIRIPPPAPSNLIPEDIPLDIIYENADLIILNKPGGMVVHPSAGHTTGTLVHAILAHAPDIKGVGGEIRPGIIHRLDKGTSGVLIVAKNDQAHRFLQKQFSERQVGKIYLALVDGSPPTPVGRVEAPVGRNPVHRKKMAVVPETKGRMAISEYQVIEKFPEHELLRIKILTGRTHQIRVHMVFIGCPVAGDRIYGRKRPTIPLERQFLHASEIKVRLAPNEEPRSFQASLAEDLQHVLFLLRAGK
jgi:23S rRNA pseudouridine1911/1915/1917 synthase